MVSAEAEGKPTLEGVAFPKDATGARSTTAFGKKVWSAAAIAAKAPDLAKEINNERNWRHKYIAPVAALAAKQMESRELALASARAGLDCIHRFFEFSRNGSTTTLAEAMSTQTTGSFATRTIKGDANLSKSHAALTLPVGGKELRGEEVVKQVREWAASGYIEEDVADAVSGLLRTSGMGEKMAERVEWNEWLHAARRRVYVLLGATSEMCPFATLMALGCTVVAVQRPSPRVQRLLDLARSSPGTLILPIQHPDPSADLETMSDEELRVKAGADVLVHTPEIRNWLLSLFPGEAMVLGSYIYLDGEAHVRASVAMDVIASSLVKKRPGTALTYLASPATCYPVPVAAVEDSEARMNKAPWWHSPASMLFGGWAKNEFKRVQSREGSVWFVYNGLSGVQGPNYALAKTLQNWRCMVAQAEGHMVSANMAPASKTDSVMHVKTVATAMKGMSSIEPLMAFEGPTASALMAMLLLHDMGNPESSAHAYADANEHPMQLFSTCGVHGGLWRCPYTLDSLGAATYMFGIFK